MIWRFLKHTFVLPFLGIYEWDDHVGVESKFFLVSPYMGNGTLIQWRTQTNPSLAEIEKRVQLLLLQPSTDAYYVMEDIASGSRSCIHPFRRHSSWLHPWGISPKYGTVLKS